MQSQLLFQNRQKQFLRMLDVFPHSLHLSHQLFENIRPFLIILLKSSALRFIFLLQGTQLNFILLCFLITHPETDLKAAQFICQLS